MDASKLFQEFLEAIDRLEMRLDRIEEQISQLSPQYKEWVDKNVMAELFHISPATLSKWRECQNWGDGSIPWIKGIHYQQLPSTERKPGSDRSTTHYLYNRPLLLHWFNSLGCPRQQIAAAEHWAKNQQVSKQRKKSQR